MERKKLFTEIPYIESHRLVLRKITEADAEGLSELVNSDAVYRYLPTFLFEKKYDDVHTVIRRLYDECFKESIILGVFLKASDTKSSAPGMRREEFCGLAEFYGFRDEAHKISVGHRYLERFWGQGIATEVLGLMVDYLYNETDIEIITASTMIENYASAQAARKNGFDLVVHASPEDWGYPEPTLTDKWIR